MQMVLNPEQFDVMLLENLYGDIVSDLGAGLIGGLGLVPGANIGEDCAVFEPVHGSAPKIAGTNCANPTAMLLSAVLMFQYLGEVEKATRIAFAVESVYIKGEVLTPDVGGTASTTQFAEAVMAPGELTPKASTARPEKTQLVDYASLVDSAEGTAEVLKVSPDTVLRDWALAKAGFAGA
jgi:isocitrate/isopropylmalate dehydrogenase